MRILLFTLFILVLASCGEQKKVSDSNPKMGYSFECKGNEVNGFFCKSTSIKNKVSYCYQTGNNGHTVPCEFYEDLNGTY